MNSTIATLFKALAVSLSFSISSSVVRADPLSVAAGKDLAANGNAKGVPACSACHGANGEGQPAAGIPRLAGIDAAYLQAQLVAFGNGARDNALMTPMSKMMDSGTMADVAAYYASLAVPAPVPAPTPDVQAGEAIALRGDWAANIPPCASCHGLNGAGVGTAFPPVAGQSATYISNQLQAWKSGTRHDDPLGLMRTIAGRLDAKQIAAVSAYYEILPAAPNAKQADKGSKP